MVCCYDYLLHRRSISSQQQSMLLTKKYMKIMCFMDSCWFTYFKVSAFFYMSITVIKSFSLQLSFKGIFRDPKIQSTLFSTHTDFIAYSERTLLY